MNARKADDLQYAKLVAKAWTDEDFKRRLLTDPMGVLAEYDIQVPAGKELRVIEDTEEVKHFILPQRPQSATYTEKSFDGRGCHGCHGGGFCGSCFGCRGCEGGD